MKSFWQSRSSQWRAESAERDRAESADQRERERRDHRDQSRKRERERSDQRDQLIRQRREMYSVAPHRSRGWIQRQHAHMHACMPSIAVTCSPHILSAQTMFLRSYAYYQWVTAAKLLRRNRHRICMLGNFTGEMLGLISEIL